MVVFSKGNPLISGKSGPFKKMALSLGLAAGSQAVCVEAGMEALRRGASELCHEELSVSTLVPG